MHHPPSIASSGAPGAAACQHKGEGRDQRTALPEFVQIMFEALSLLALRICAMANDIAALRTCCSETVDGRPQVGDRLAAAVERGGIRMRIRRPASDGSDPTTRRPGRWTIWGRREPGARGRDLRRTAVHFAGTIPTPANGRIRMPWSTVFLTGCSSHSRSLVVYPARIPWGAAASPT